MASKRNNLFQAVKTSGSIQMLCHLRTILLRFAPHFALVVLSIALNGTAFAQTTISGPIATDMSWTLAGSPYVLSGETSVQGGAKLTIEAGVKVYMGAGSSLVVQSGSIRAQGTTASPIQVLSDKSRLGQTPAPGDWNQWVFMEGTTATRLDHVVIEYGKGVVMNGCAPIFNDVALLNHLGAAISIDLAASPTGVGNSASGNLVNGVAVPAGEITGQVRWGLRGIPYVISAGSLSVGTAPRVLALDPTSLQQGDTVTVSLSGSRLSGIRSPSFDAPGLTASLLPGASDVAAALSVTADATARTGPASLSIVTDAGAASLANAITVNQGLPSITALDPTSVVVNQGPLTLSVTGRHFNGTTQVTLDGAPLATSVQGTAQLRATVPNLTFTGNSSVRARTADPANPGGFLLSNSVLLPVLASGPLALTPGSLSVVQGRTKTLSVTLPYAAPVGGFAVNLASSAPAIASVPATVVVPAGQMAANVDVTALQEGSAAITASRAGFLSAHADVTVTLTVTYTIVPIPLVALPNGKPRTFTVEASDAVSAQVEFSATSLNPAVAAVGAPNIVLPAGTTSGAGTIAGVSVGNTTLLVQRVGSATPPLQAQVYVGDDLAGGALGYTNPIGLLRNVDPGTPAGAVVGPVASQALGLVRNTDSVVPPGAIVGPVFSQPLGLVRNVDSGAPGANVGTLASQPVGLVRNTVSSVPAGTEIGPVASQALGLVRDTGLGVPIGSNFGPLVSQPLGLSRSTSSSTPSTASAGSSRAQSVATKNLVTNVGKASPASVDSPVDGGVKP